MAAAFQEQPKDSPAGEAPDLVEALRVRVACLKAAVLPRGAETDQKVAEALGIMVQLLVRIEQTLSSQLEVLGRSNPRVKSMAETVREQGLLSVESALQAVLGAPQARLTRLTNYSDLLLRWWSAVLAGVQSTVMEAPNEIEQGLNPAHWQVEKKRWGSEDAAFWSHFKFVIRPELPLRIGDRLKQLQAEKTLDAYAVLGEARPSEKA